MRRLGLRCRTFLLGLGPAAAVLLISIDRAYVAMNSGFESKLYQHRLHSRNSAETANQSRCHSDSAGDSSISLPLRICRKLDEDLLHRRHAQTAELDRLDREYALTYDVLRTGYIRGHVKAELLHKVAFSEPVTVLTLGGSFTRGHGCGETPQQGERYCAWPSRLERWWKTYFSPGVESQFVHHSEHGTGSVNALQRIGVIVQALVSKPDLVILDFLVNDVHMGDDNGAVGYATAGFEKLLQAIRELLPETQILLFEAGCRKCVTSIKTRQRRRNVALQYNIPTIDYAAMVQTHNKVNSEGPDVLWPKTDPPTPEGRLIVGDAWPDFAPRCNVTKGTCCPENHPPWPVHQYVSDSIAFGLITMLKDEGCTKAKDQTSFHMQSELARFPSCIKPLAWHDALASQNETAISPISEGKWRLYEDKPGRPGWITTERGATISFPVRFGAQPMLAVTYLRSYANLGTAEISLTSHSGVSSKLRLQGLWANNYSLPDTAFFVDRGGDANLISDPLKSDGYDHMNGRWKEDGTKIRDYSVELTLAEGDKFKVTQVISC